MRVDKFVALVASMRTAQKDYFKNRLQLELIKSKRLESEVDTALREGVTMADLQPVEVQGKLLEDGHEQN